MRLRMMSHSICYASTATARQPNLVGDNEEDEELVLKKRKEALLEECDESIVGLSTAKAKAKAKELHESQNLAKSVLQRVWAILLGIGPALRAVASVSREDLAKNLGHLKRSVQISTAALLVGN